ncbi:flavodoxin family protein [Neobittarella massiliensis]|uniref:Flavodoxin family protein n=1 Tax=Neobittarella massiliensis (ex Bilen et al. 2018) TaxID=2041842 RepID=A0A8J6M1H9_9FIRM|nr:flavodoxin family protein [Neobittarella massiliensis]MBC3516346.1 flavodoxin family protein [Neobittarella massiliensis]
MHILMITGSPHRNGTSALLADRFMVGATDAGHKIARFDVAFQKVRPCTACDACKQNGGHCVLHDDMEVLAPMLKEADVVVLVTPLYYYGMSAQLKAVIDRFYALGDQLRTGGKKAALMATCGDGEESAFDALVAHYRAMCSYLKWRDCGIVLAPGCYLRADIENSDYPQLAYELGLGMDR